MGGEGGGDGCHVTSYRRCIHRTAACGNSVVTCQTVFMKAGISNTITDTVSTVRSTVSYSFGLVLTAGAGFWLQVHSDVLLRSHFFTNYTTVHRASSNRQ